MKPAVNKLNEEIVAAAFTRQSAVFDTIYSADTVIRYKRWRVRRHIEHYLSPQSDILELNAGTGEDAIYFAGQGHNVHATDLSEGMLDQLNNKVKQHQLQEKISNEQCSFTALDTLQHKGPYDLVFSNFSGLNCTNDLTSVLNALSVLVKPGGFVILVLLPSFCLWEFLLLGKGKFKTALRRFTGKKGAKAHVEGEYFRCWYYSPSFIRKHTRKYFEVMALEGLCTIVPPSYLQHFAEKHPQLYAFLEKTENKYCTRWPWKTIGDYYIMTLRRKG